MAKTKKTKKTNRARGVVVMLPADNPWASDPHHCGEMTVRELVGLVCMDEFPSGLDTKIKIGDVEGNEGVNKTLFVTAHKPGDVVLSVDMHCGDEYDPYDDGPEGAGGDMDMDMDMDIDDA